MYLFESLIWKVVLNLRPFLTDSRAPSSLMELFYSGNGGPWCTCSSEHYLRRRWPATTATTMRRVA